MRAFVVALVACAHPVVAREPTVSREPRSAVESRFALEHPDAMIQRVRVVGAPASVLPPLASRPGDRIRTAPIHEDVRALWALGIASDIRVDATQVPGGVDLAFVLTPQRLVEAVTITGSGRDRPELRRMKLLVGLPFDPARIARMAAGVERSYHRDGHIDATVRVACRGTQIRVATTLGPRVVIGKIWFPGNTAIANPLLLDTVRGDDTNQVGGIYDAAALDEARLRLVYEYYKRGFATAQIGEPVMKRHGDRLEVEIPVHEGPKFQFGEVKIVGALRVMRPRELSPGQQFTPTRVHAEVVRLQDRYGAVVDISTVIDPATRRLAVTFQLEWPWPSDILRSLR